MKVWFFVLAALLLAAAPSAYSAVLWNQPGTPLAVIDQDFPDFSDASSYEFDDIVVGAGGWNISRVTVYGDEDGNAAYNQSISLAFGSAPDVSARGTVYAGSQIGSDLVFTSPITLSPGTYWISAWPTRPISGGQWFWKTTPTITGSEAFYQNPGDLLGYGGTPLPMSATDITGGRADMAFLIEGETGNPTDGDVPEASSILLAISSLPVMGAATRLRRRK